MIDEDELSCTGKVFSSILGIYTIVEDPGGTDSLRKVTVMWDDGVIARFMYFHCLREDLEL